MMSSTARFVYLGWVDTQYIDTAFHFTYYGFDWVRPLGRAGLYSVYALMFISAAAITLGYRYRIASILLFLTFTYTELLDISYYLNHYYFVSLMCFLFIWLPLHKVVSMDVKSDRTSPATSVPLWMLHSIMLMVGIVYFYAGIAKINYDWLIEALPLKIWLPAHDDLPMIGVLLQKEWIAYLFSWVGMLYDTLIVGLLLWPKTRKWAFVSVVIFHTLTGILFQIGVFPLVMICAVSIYFSSEWHRRRLMQLCRWIEPWHLSHLNNDPDLMPLKLTIRHDILRVLLVCFFGFQLIFPFRYLLYPGNLFWTEEGYRFSWRVMLMEKAGTATFYVKDGNDGREGIVFNNQFLNSHQEKQMAMQPDMILQYAHHLSKYYLQQGMKDPQVRVEAYVTLNGKPSRLLIDPQLNLLTVEDSWLPKKWILPDK